MKRRVTKKRPLTQEDLVHEEEMLEHLAEEDHEIPQQCEETLYDPEGDMNEEDKLKVAGIGQTVKFEVRRAHRSLGNALSPFPPFLPACCLLAPAPRSRRCVARLQKGGPRPSCV